MAWSSAEEVSRPIRTKRRTFLIWTAPVVLAIVAATSACRKTERSADQTASSEASVTKARVVSLSPSTTETLFAIGASDAVVGRSRYCNFPPEVTSLPQVGGYVDPNLEAILALKPDLVTGARGPAGKALTDKLENRQIAVFFPPTESFEQIDAMILGLGERTNRRERANAVVEHLHARVRAVESAVATKEKPRVLLVFGFNPLSVAGPSSFANEMIRRAGAINAVTEGGTYPTLGVERVLSLDPDVIVNAAMAESGGKPRIQADTPGFQHVRAVQTGRVVSIDEDTVLRPGPRIGEGLAVLARALHPDLKTEEIAP